MDAIISVLVYVGIIFVVISRIKSKRRQFGKQPEKTRSVNNPVAPTKQVSQARNYGQEMVNTSYKKNKATGINVHMAREKANTHGWEDRRGDWLARQMAEEKAAQRRVSEMFQLKLEHRYNCDAEMLKQFHESHCDADKVDDVNA